MSSKFTKWYEQTEFNENNPEEERLYTETQLKRDLKMKLKEDAKGEWIKIYTGGRWKEFEFFKIDQAIPLKTRKKVEIKDIEINPKNICEALYVINKSAKISRDTKKLNYGRGNYGVVSGAKTRETKLYELKNKVMDKLIKNNILKLLGYHMQGETYLKLYKYDNYTFHNISNAKEVEGLENLGNIDLISAEYKIKPIIKFTDATNLLNKYIS